MIKENLFSHYEKENDRKQNFDDNAINLAAFISATFSIDFALINNLQEINNSITYFVVGSTILKAISLVFVSISYNNWFSGHEYWFLASYSDIDKLANDAEKEDEYQNLLKNCIDHNNYKNNDRSEKLYSAKSLFLISLISLVIASGIYAYKTNSLINGPEQEQKTEQPRGTRKGGEASQKKKIQIETEKSKTKANSNED